MRIAKAAGYLAATALLLSPAACSSSNIPSSQGAAYKPYMIGEPYRIKGRWYRPREDFGYDRVGVASWYGSDSHGRRTANGEIYDMNAVTAAHPTLPLPTIVRVENLDNGRSILVRINDRGPFAKGRLIDMSRAGARMLGFEEKGVARVRVTVVREASLRLKQAASVAGRVEGNASATTSSWPRTPRASASPDGATRRRTNLRGDR